MARRSSGRSRSSGFSMPRPAARSTPTPKPKPAATPRAPARQPASVSAPMQTGSVTGGLGSVVAEGMAFGGGSAIAHRAVDALTGPRVIKHETVDVSASSAAPTPPVNSACGNQYKAFQDCMNSSGSEISRCQFYMDMLAECHKSTPSGLNV